MKNLLLLLVTCGIVAGCASPNPSFNPGQPPSAANPPYIPNTNVTTGVAIGQAANGATAPFNPYAPLVDIGLTAAAAIAAWIAKKKNDEAASAKATTSALAASVVAQGTSVSQNVLDHATNNEATFPAVADALNKKTVV